MNRSSFPNNSPVVRPEVVGVVPQYPEHQFAPGQSSTCSIVIPSTINCVIRIKLIKELESSSITGKRIKGGHFDFDDIDLFAQSTRKQSNRSVGQHIGNIHTKASQCGDPTDCYHHRKPDISFGWEAERARNFLHRREAWDNVLALEEGQFHLLPWRGDGEHSTWDGRRMKYSLGS